MSSSRSVPSKSSVTSTVIPPLPALPKLPSRLQTKCITSVHPNAIKKDVKAQENQNGTSLSSIQKQDGFEDIVNNLSTIVKRSEKLLTPVKPQIATSIRRTSSLHITKLELDRRKLANSTAKAPNSHCNSSGIKPDNCSKLHDSISDRSSECSIGVSNSIPRRTSIRPLHNVEKYSGIKCALPSFTPTMPNTFKALEKHFTPMNNKKNDKDNQVTPANTSRREKSPWRLRFEKFLSHQEPTPISPIIHSVVSNKTMNSSLGKENRTPSFRLSTRRASKFNIPS